MNNKKEAIESLKRMLRIIYRISKIYNMSCFDDMRIADILNKHLPEYLSEIGFDDLFDMLCEWAKNSIKELENGKMDKRPIL